jgi:hypothetical protein
MEARSAIRAMHHAAAMEAGKKAMARENEEADAFKAEWKEVKKLRQRHDREAGQQVPIHMTEAFAPIRSYTFQDKPVYKPMHRSKAVRKAGEVAYRKHRKWLSRQPLPEFIEVETTLAELLRAAGLGSNGSYHGRLVGALDRLCKPIGESDLHQELGPLLQSWQRRRSLCLKVASTWLEPRYRAVPWPLPVHSPTTLALYLFLHSGIDTGIVGNEAIPRKRLYARLGISLSAGPASAKHTLDKALAAVNQHIARPIFDREALQNAKIRLPVAYRIKDQGGDWARLATITEREVEAEEDCTIQERPRIQRRRFTNETSGWAATQSDAEWWALTTRQRREIQEAGGLRSRARASANCLSETVGCE